MNEKFFDLKKEKQDRIDCCVDLQLRADGWTDYGL